VNKLKVFVVFIGKSIDICINCRCLFKARIRPRLSVKKLFKAEKNNNLICTLCI